MPTRIAPQAIPLGRYGQVHEDRVATFDGGIKVSKGLVQQADLTVEQRQLHGACAGCAGNGPLDDRSAAAARIDVAQFVEHGSPAKAHT